MNLDNFIDAWNNDADLLFVVGARAYVTGTRMWYRFTSNLGVYILDLDSQMPVSAPTLSATTGAIAQGADGVINLTTCTGTIDLAQIFNDAIAKDFDVKIDLTGSGAQNITLAMLDNANALATAKHSLVASVVGTNGTVASGSAAAAANWGLAFSSTGVKHHYMVEFTDVNIAAETYVYVRGGDYTNPVASNVANAAGTKTFLHEDATIMRGIRLVVSAGSVSGTITVKAKTR